MLKKNISANKKQWDKNSEVLQLEAIIMIIVLELENYAKRKAFQNFFALKAFVLRLQLIFLRIH